MNVRPKDKQPAIKQARQLKVQFDEIVHKIRTSVMKERTIYEHRDRESNLINNVDIGRATQTIEDQRFIQQFSLLFEKNPNQAILHQRRATFFIAI